MSAARTTVEGHRASAALAMLFDSYAERDVPYVVARKHEGLPETRRGDVDIFVRAGRFDEAVRIAEALGFERQAPGTARNALGLLADAATRPGQALGTLLDAPRNALAMLAGGSGGKHGYRNVKLEGHGAMLDLRNHVAYVSPWNGERVRVDPLVEQRLYERRDAEGDVATPSPPDELAHLVAHCVFDKRGRFSDYAAARCDDLFETVQRDPEADAAFRELLSLQFFDAADLVYDAVTAGEYDDLRARLFRFDDY